MERYALAVFLYYREFFVALMYESHDVPII